MKLIECPRDAMQGISAPIPTEIKVNYIQSLLDIGFHTIDFGSFVSPKAVPQMADTAQVIDQLNTDDTNTQLLAIVANERGADDALLFEKIHYLGFPFSISPTFQQRNTNASQQEALERVKHIQEKCVDSGKELVVYLSMAFGNPYGDDWSIESIEPWVSIFDKLGVTTLALSDTIGKADKASIANVFKYFIPKYKNIEFGAHFHSSPKNWQEKIDAALKAGCTRFDSTIRGIGGCPMADDELVGNIATENLLMFLAEKNIDIDFIQQDELLESIKMAKFVFNL